jgi:hypothetical protein
MKVMIASNDHPNFLRYWRINAEYWGSIGFQPVLCYVPKDPDIKPAPANYGNVIQLPYVENCDLPIGMQAKFARWFVPTFFYGIPCTICDMDMLPLFNRYFFGLRRHVRRQDKNTITVMGRKRERHRICPGRYVSSYASGYGEAFHKLIGLETSFEKFIKSVIEFVERTHGTAPFRSKDGSKILRASDEGYLTEKLETQGLTVSEFPMGAYVKKYNLTSERIHLKGRVYKLRHKGGTDEHVKVSSRRFQRFLNETAVDIHYNAFERILLDDKDSGHFHQILETHRKLNESNSGVR